MRVSLCVMGGLVSSGPGFGGEEKGRLVKVCMGVLVTGGPPYNGILVRVPLPFSLYRAKTLSRLHPLHITRSEKCVEMRVGPCRVS